jgi:hypothetical protein
MKSNLKKCFSNIAQLLGRLLPSDPLRNLLLHVSEKKERSARKMYKKWTLLV